MVIEEIVASWGMEYQVKKMFGGVAYMLHGNMACATLSTGELIIRTLDEDKPELLKIVGVTQAFMKGQDMGNWVSVDPESLEPQELAELMTCGKNKALSLPPKWYSCRMARNKRKYSIPPPPVVRVFAVFILLMDIAVMTVSVLNYDALGWTAYVLFFGTAASMYLPIMALKTGDPEWILLDLIIPG